MLQFCILFYANYTILATQRGGHAPPKYALQATHNFCLPCNTKLLTFNTNGIHTKNKLNAIRVTHKTKTHFMTVEHSSILYKDNTGRSHKN